MLMPMPKEFFFLSRVFVHVLKFALFSFRVDICRNQLSFKVLTCLHTELFLRLFIGSLLEKWQSKQSQLSSGQNAEIENGTKSKLSLVGEGSLDAYMVQYL